MCVSKLVVSKASTSAESLNSATAAFKSAMDAARQISASYGISPQRSFQRQMDSLERQFAEAYTSGRNVIILLDDAQLMASDASEANPVRKANIEQILRAGWYLLELINEILDLAVIESGK